MDEETIIYIGFTMLISVLVLFTLGSYGPYKIVVAVLAIFNVFLILIINYADFLIFPLITRIFGLSTVPTKDYLIPKQQDLVLKNVNGLYYSTGYLTANVYNYVFSQEEVASDAEAKLANSPEKWERIVMNVHFPFKFHSISYAHDIQQYRDDLEGKRGFLEFQLSKEMSGGAPSQMAVDDYQRRINILQAKIDRLSGGERPVGNVMYIETTAVGVSEKASRDMLENQLSQLETVFNSMDISISRVVGRELYLLFRFNYVIPTTADEIDKLFHQQR